MSNFSNLEGSPANLTEFFFFMNFLSLQANEILLSQISPRSLPNYFEIISHNHHPTRSCTVLSNESEQNKPHCKKKNKKTWEKESVTKTGEEQEQ